ncbi:MAG: NYN domain-containing protein [Roseiflexus sp.]|nr:NYN domain-containing protein [Roseiflexus sp.]MCS7287894.1 NYN domain-containing protein [Roseiflexus sp.]MDW8233035.1 NYN domain-containing protein [Roseiflexaceae bacterium]
MATDNPRLDVALFIDFENVYVSVRDKLDVNPNFEIIMDRVADLGRVVIARAYADWYRYPRVTSALYANGIEPMYVPTYYYDRDLGRTGRAIKNSVDMNLCIDAMKTLYTNPNIAKFVLVTGDRDFIPLVNAIRQHGKEVIIIGVGGAASGHLAQSADEFIFYEQLLGKKPQPLQDDIPRIRTIERGRDIEDVVEPVSSVRMRQEPQPAERTPPPEPPATEAPREEPDIYDMLVRAVHLARERGYVCSFGSLKLIMKELMGGEFKESKYRDSTGKPFAKFKDFALEAERRGKVQVFTSGTIVEVFLPGEDPYKLSQFAQDLKEEPPASTPETPIHTDAHIDGRPVSTGRRRRRRRGGASRPTTAPETTVAQPQDFALREDVTDELMAETLRSAVNGGTAAADDVFEELLDRLEAERERQEALASLDMRFGSVSSALDELPDLEEEPDLAARSDDVADEPVLEAPDLADQMIIIDTPIEPPEMFEAPKSSASEAMPAAEARPFTDAEWQMLRDVVKAAGRPLSFAQIHDRLREARNNASIFRTNEELRSLIKQAINTGVLRRSGKGARVVYYLAPQETLESANGAGAEPLQAPIEDKPADAIAAAPETSVVMYAVETEIVVTSAESAPATAPEPVAVEAPASDISTVADMTAGTQAGTAPEIAEPAAETETSAPAPVAAAGEAIGEEVSAVAAEGLAVAEDIPHEPSVVVEASAESEATAPVESAPIDITVADQPKSRRRRTVARLTADTDEKPAESASAAHPKRSRSKAAVAAPTEEAPRPTRRRKKVEATEDSSEAS